MIVSTLNQIRGCIISWGTWYASGTCATFRAEKASGSLLDHHLLQYYRTDKNR
jgi:hypothetical protein